jgi:hypothetical protein
MQFFSPLSMFFQKFNADVTILHTILFVHDCEGEINLLTIDFSCGKPKARIKRTWVPRPKRSTEFPKVRKHMLQSCRQGRWARRKTLQQTLFRWNCSPSRGKVNGLQSRGNDTMTLTTRPWENSQRKKHVKRSTYRNIDYSLDQMMVAGPARLWSHPGRSSRLHKVEGADRLQWRQWDGQTGRYYRAKVTLQRELRD